MRNHEELERMGWTVVVVWECQIKQNFDATISWITSILAK